MRYWKFILLAVLLVLNTVLFLSWKKQRENREKIQFILTHNEPIADYLAKQSERLYYLSEPLRQSGYPSSIVSYSDSLRNAIHKLQANTVTVAYETMSTDEYFESTVSVPADQQEKLWIAAQQYTTSLTTIVEEYIPAEKRQWDSVYVLYKEQFRQKEQRLLSSPLVYHSVNQKALLMVELTLPLRTLHIMGYKMKNENFIRWETPALLTYQRILESKVNSPKALQASKQLSKFSSLFVAKGKLMMYGKIINLSSLTPAELQSVCKYLLLTKAETEIVCGDAFSEFQTYF